MCAQRPLGVGNDGGVCIGSYTSTTTLPGCSNMLVASDAIILSGIDISRAGAKTANGHLTGTVSSPAGASASSTVSFDCTFVE